MRALVSFRVPSAPLARALRAAALLLAALAISALAVLAGRWQYSRHETRSHTLHAYEAAQGLDPAPLSTLDGAGSDALPAASEWRLATASGAFVPGSTTVLRNRAVEGVRVSEYLAWFVTDDGHALLVLTGYTALADGEAAPVVPDGPVAIVVQLRPQEPDDGKRGDGATRITAAQMPAPPAPALAGFGVLAGDCDAACEAAYGARVPDPKLSLGPHLAYTVQWYALAVFAPLGAVLMLVRRRPGDDGADDADGAAGGGAAGEDRDVDGDSPRTRRRRRRERGPSDEEVEDAL
jgi:cytochrome oxidase assembly protein ShyY1